MLYEVITTYPQLGYYIARPSHGLGGVSSQADFERRAFGPDHALGESTNQIQSFRIDIDQPKLRQWERIHSYNFV